ncbi:type VII secretion system-associated protein [Amycolatopsis minnesotensis]|uniref:Type VII secretion system-associated protein n=1 Tax=Amycolatopsis minnesotensis TaxID=337894 RepID=A0ABN2SS56_9PSEU
MSEATEQARVWALVDPGWTATDEVPEPPIEALVGAWPLAPDGGRGLFQPNPGYRPSTPDSPLDPVDAVIGAIARDEADAEQLPALLREVTFGVAVDDQGVVIVRPAPDGVPSALVTTSHGHRDRVAAAGWLTVSLAELADALPDQGVDVLLNPGAPNSLRLLADAVRATAAGG